MIMMILGGLYAFLPVKIWKVIIWKVFPHMLGWIFSLMREILHACRESGRNSVQAGDSLSMRESWKPCYTGYPDLYFCMSLERSMIVHGLACVPPPTDRPR